MTLEQYAAIAEIIGGLAVLLTLIYLVIEIRKSNRLSRAESRRSTMGHSANMAMVIGQSREASEVFYRGLIEHENLSPSEEIQFGFLFSILSGHADLAYTDWALGLSDDDSFKTSIRAFVSLLKTPGGRAYWCRYGPNNSTPFYNYIIDHAYAGEAP